MKNINLGDRIKEKRIEAGLTQEKFAELTNVSKWTIINWENNKRIPLATSLIDIAFALRTTANYLLYGREDSERAADAASREDVSGLENFLNLPIYSLKDINEKPSSLFSVIVTDNSMKDLGIPYGATAVINPFEECKSMDVAMIKYGGKAAIRKICYMPDGNIQLISAEQYYFVPFSTKENLSDFAVYGRVCWVLSAPHHGI